MKNSSVKYLKKLFNVLRVWIFQFWIFRVWIFWVWNFWVWNLLVWNFVFEFFRFKFHRFEFSAFEFSCNLFFRVWIFWMWFFRIWIFRVYFRVWIFEFEFSGCKFSVTLQNYLPLNFIHIAYFLCFSCYRSKYRNVTEIKFLDPSWQRHKINWLNESCLDRNSKLK